MDGEPSGAAIDGRDGASQEPSDFLLDEGDWVDVTPSPSIDLGSAPQSAPQPQRVYGAPPHANAAWIWALIVLGLVALGLIAWRTRTQRRAPQLLLESSLTAGVRNQISASFGADGRDAAEPDPQPSRPTPPSARESAPSQPQAPVSPAPPPERRDPPDTRTPGPTPDTLRDATPDPQTATETARPSLSFQVTGATRSVMTFTLAFRFTIANRSDQALRDLAVYGQIASAQRSQPNAPTLHMGQPIGAIDRIGPQQSHTITGTLELPMVEVRMIQQGSVPVFVPLVHITLEATGQPARTSSFVIGTPSETSQQRLHPIALDGSPGAVRGLRANPIKPFVSDEETSPSQA